MKDTLNTKIWNDNNSINQRVRKNLLKISKDFIEYCKIKNLKMIDIIITGSISNFSWHSKSDIDLHVLFDLTNFGKHSNFIFEYLQTKKSVWNYKHGIKIYGFEVEIYPEDKNRNQKLSSAYSLIKNSWIIFPEKKEIKVDKELIKSKYQSEVDKILQFESISKKKNFDYEELLNKISKYKENLRNKRTTALSELGEFSVDNIVFKMLRRNNFLEKLTQLSKDIYDNALTLERFRINNILENLESGDKFILNRNAANLHGNKNDRYKIIMSQSINESGLEGYIIRNLRIRKDYHVEKDVLHKFLNKNYITKE